MRFSRETTTLFLLVASVIALGQGTDITFTVKGLEAPEAYLGYHLADQKFVEDTLQVAPGGVMKISDEEGLRPGLYFIYVQGGVFVEFIINEPKFNIVMEGEGYEGFVVEGSEENEAFKRFQLRLGKLQAQRIALMDSLQQLTGSDSLMVRQQISELGTEANTVRDDIIEANPELMISKMLRLMQPVPIQDFPEITDQKRTVGKSFVPTKRPFVNDWILKKPVFFAHRFLRIR